MTRLARPLLASLVASCVGLAPLACTVDDGDQTSVASAPSTLSDTATDSTTSGDGDGDTAGDGDGDEEGCVGVVPIANEPPDMGDGDGDAGDGDGDASTGDGDGEPTTGGETTGDGDGDPTTGDGDGDSTTGDGDGDATTGDGDGDAEPPCEDCAPYWRLWDFQPQSCGYDQYYGLDSFEGHVTLVALLAGWCSYCQGQAQRMDQLRLQLRNEGYEVQMIAINGTTADNEEDRQALVDRCSFPLFQDVSGQNAWTLQGGSKDDMFVYRADGTLFAALPNGGDIPTNLGTEEGYEAVKQQLIDASE